MRLADLNYVALDTETTGFDPTPGKGSIVELAAIWFRLDGTELGRFSVIVNPGMPIPEGAMAVHGITDEVAALGRTPEDALLGLLSFLPRLGESVLLAHNAPFDVGFLAPIIAQSQLRSLTYYNGYCVLDTLAMARKALPRLYNHKLGTVAEHYGVTETGAHRAMADAETCMRIFLAMVAPYGPDAMLADIRGTETVYKFTAPHAVSLKAWGDGR